MAAQSDEEINNYWTRHFDQNYNCYYYVNYATGDSQWEYPSGIGDVVQDQGSEEIIDTFNKSAPANETHLKNEIKYREGRYGKSIANIEKRWDLDAEKSNTEDSPETTARKNRSYLQMARLYKVYRPYSDPAYKPKCVLCRKVEPIDVFFPCEHRCVCRPCIKKEQICDDVAFQSNINGYCNCSLCAEIIKIILPFENGLEVEKYWKWAFDQKIDLPDGFMRNFKHSAAVIKAVYMNPGARDAEERSDSAFCAVSWMIRRFEGQFFLQ